MDSQEHLSPSIDSPFDQQTPKCQILYEDGHPLGIQQFLIHPDDRWKAAFTTEFGLFQLKVMFFGLCNFPGIHEPNLPE
jgi:hypothetical protein